MTGITYPSLATNSFAYNAFGARMSITDSAGTRALRRSGASVLAPVVKEGSSDRYLPGVWESHSGSALNPWSGIKNAENQLKAGGTDSRTYDAFGNVLSQSANWTSSALGYAGRYGYLEDKDSGLKLLGYRYYDPDLGRFLSRDPAKHGRNWYVYCDNNPLTRVDPAGLDWVDDASDFFAGWGDALTMGGTGWVRDQLGVDVVDQGSGWYVGGSVVGEAHSLALDLASGGAKSGARAARALDDAVPNPGSFDDMADQARKRIPDDWNEKPAKRGGGVRWVSPDGRNSVRLDPGDPITEMPHVHVIHNGQPIGRDGYPIPAAGKRDPDRHIPYDTWKDWPNWYGY